MKDEKSEERQEQVVKRDSDHRTAYEVDYARVIHSASFRRLQGKTQILNLGDSDFYRTRLTHSLEVSQIATGIISQLEKQRKPRNCPKLDKNLIRAISLTHDLGHPPFGHGGEISLNYCMRKHGGFEGNGQSLRILTSLEKFSENHGANLTRRTLLGLLKYPACFKDVNNSSLEPCLSKSATAISIIDRKKSKPPKCFLETEQSVVDWILKPFSPKDRSQFGQYEEKSEKHAQTKYKSFDCSIMDIADDIAYGVHDLEDVVALNLVKRDEFYNWIKDKSKEDDLDKFGKYFHAQFDEDLSTDYLDFFADKIFGSGGDRKKSIGLLVHYFITNIKYKTIPKLTNPLLKYNAELSEGLSLLLALKNFVYEKVIRSPNVQHLEFKGQQMVVSVFEAVMSEPDVFLPEYYLSSKKEERDVCDFIAGMTDSYLLKTYDRLFSPHTGSVFDSL